MEQQAYSSRMNDSINRQPLSWEAMMRRRSSMSASSLRRCSLLSVSMFDMPAFQGKGDLLLDDHNDMDPFAPLSFDHTGHQGDPKQQQQQQLQQQQQPRLQHPPRQLRPQMNDFNSHSNFLNAGVNSNCNVILNDRSDSSRLSYCSNGNNSLPMMVKSRPPLPTVVPGSTSAATSLESGPSFAANVSPLSCTKPAVQVSNQVMSSSNPVPNLASSSTVSDNNNNNTLQDDEDDEAVSNQHRFKPFHEEKWTLRYKELLAFHQEHGHAAVPHTYPRNPQLARWVKRQRRQYKLRRDGRPSTMTTERLEMLSSVGFVWDSHDVNWREKLDSLQSFRKEHSHCNVPSNYVDKKLATWVKCQRRQYKLYWDGKPSAMSPERILELEKVGFEWEIRSTVPRKAAMAKQQQQQQQQQQTQQEEFSLLYQNIPDIGR